MALFTHPHDLLSYMETERDILKNVGFTFFHEITKIRYCSYQVKKKKLYIFK